MIVLPFPTPDDASVFDTSTVRILTNAARCIIEVAKLGERDQRRPRDAALAHLDEANIRKARE